MKTHFIKNLTKIYKEFIYILSKTKKKKKKGVYTYIYVNKDGD